jgi:transposase-like protein
MSQKSTKPPSPSERLVRDIRWATRKQYSAEEKIRIVLDGLRGEASVAELCRRDGIAESMYYIWSKEFLEAGKRRLSQRIRKRIEEAFGWTTTVAGMARIKLRGLPKVDWVFTFAAAAYNLVRLPKLLAEPA